VHIETPNSGQRKDRPLKEAGELATAFAGSIERLIARSAQALDTHDEYGLKSFGHDGAALCAGEALGQQEGIEAVRAIAREGWVCLTGWRTSSLPAAVTLARVF